jgi:uncharacterized protein YlxP (DUF503 family)
MPRACTCCTHKERAAIDAALTEGQSYRTISRRFNVSVAAVQRHKEHAKPAIQKAVQALEARTEQTILEQVRDVHDRTMRVLIAAETAKDPGVMLKAIAEARRNLELLAKLSGELDDRPVVNVTISAEWLELRGVIVNALQPFPEARTAVSLALEGTNL